MLPRGNKFSCNLNEQLRILYARYSLFAETITGDVDDDGGGRIFMFVRLLFLIRYPHSGVHPRNGTNWIFHHSHATQKETERIIRDKA